MGTINQGLGGGETNVNGDALVQYGPIHLDQTGRIFPNCNAQIEGLVDLGWQDLFDYLFNKI